MAFTDPIATAIVEIEPVAQTEQFRRAAEQAANNFNSTLQSSMQRVSARINTTFANIAAGFRTLGQAIAARLPQQFTAVASRLSSSFGSAFGTIRAGLSNLNSSFSSAFTKISGGAAVAAIAIGAIGLAVVKVTKSFAEIADGFRQVELGLNAVIASSSTANTTTEELVGTLQNLGTSLGVSSVALGRSAQQLITLGLTGDQTERVLTAISTAAARTGATSAQAGRALDGLTQIVSKGTLQMEELRRQIAGNLPGAINLGRVFEILAQNMNVSVEEVRKLQESGQITAAQAIPAITQAMEELNGNVDVLALRLSTLDGVFSILRENFNQIIGTSFQSFIEAVLPTLRTFLDQLKNGSPIVSKIQSDISRFGEVIGTAFVQILEQVVPLLPQLFNLFTNLTQALAPLVVEMVKIGATVLKIVIPVINFLAQALDVVLNRIPILSTILRTLVAGVLVGGVFKAFATFARALGSIGGLLGRIATPLSNLLKGLSSLSTVVAKVTVVLGFLRAPIEALIGVLDAALEKVGQLIGFIGRLPGVSQVVGAIGSVGRAIGDAFSDDNKEKVDKITESTIESAKSVLNMSEALGGLNKSLRDTVDDQEALLEAQKKVDDAQKDLAQTIRDEAAARRQLDESIRDEQEAKEDLAEINADLIELEQERAELVADTARDIRDIAKAQRDLEKIGFRLLDIEEDRRSILQEIKELSTGATADEIAAADNKIAKANFDLNEAYAERLALQQELNKSQEQGIDLSGLTLDQLRTTLAGLRLQTTAQRSVQRQGRSEEDIRRDLEEINIRIVDLELDKNEAIQDRIDLDNIVFNNQGKIQKLTRDLRDLEIEKADALDDQVESQEELNTLLAGETPRQLEILALDEKIADQKERQQDAIERVRDAGVTIRENEEKVAGFAAAIKADNDAIATAKRDQALKTAEIKGDEGEINRLLLERIGFNSTLLGQAGQLASTTLSVQAISALGPEFLTRFFGGYTPQEIADFILTNPNALRNILRQLGASGFAEGGVIQGVNSNFGRIIRAGEFGRSEMILPLQSGPQKVWDLLSKNIPKYPSLSAGVAAAAAQQMPTISSVPNAVSSAKRIQNRDDGPATFGQIRELINILREHRTEVHVEAPITVESKGSDDLLAKKIERRVERNIMDKISRR